MVRKTQTQITETILVGTIMCVILMIAMSIYFTSKINEMKSNIEEQKRVGAIYSTQIIIFSPEISCEDRVYCADKEKLKAILGSQDLQEEFKDILGYGEIKVIEIYPDYEEFVIYNNSISKSKYNITYKLPINIYDPISKENGLGIIKIKKSYIW